QRGVRQVGTLPAHLHLGLAVVAALQHGFPDAVGRGRSVLVLEALGAERAPVRPGGNGVPRRAGARVDAKKVVGRVGREAEVGYRRRLPLAPLPHDLVLGGLRRAARHLQRALGRRAAPGDRRRAEYGWSAGWAQRAVLVEAVRLPVAIVVDPVRAGWI